MAPPRIVRRTTCATTATAFVTVRNDDSMLVLDLVSGDTLARVPVQR